MNYDIDVLLVFADADDQPLNKGEKGWVSQFRKFLEMMLVQVLGAKSHIVVIDELSDYEAALNQAAVMVPILSKDFMASGKCQDRVEQFYRHVSGTTPGQQRIFKVLKSQVPPSEQPRIMRDWLGYDMFQTDLETTVASEYIDFFSPEAERQFWMKLVDLAYDIHDSILALKGKEIPKMMGKGKTIFLAEAANDLSIQRSIIRRELQRYGYAVLPSHTLPASVSEVESVVKDNLNRSAIAIHLIGSLYGSKPHGSDLSVVEIQNEIAAEVAREKLMNGEEFLRLLWITPVLKNMSKEQLSFISNIKRNGESQSGAEIFQNSIEDFKNLLRYEFLEKNRVVEESVPGRSLYLIYDSVDADEISPFKEEIVREGIKILEPAFQGDLLAVRKQHISNLRNMDGAIIFKGKVNEQWVRMKILDLLKAPGFGRSKPIRAKGILTTGDAASLNGFRNQHITLIAGDIGHSMESMKVLIKEI